MGVAALAVGGFSSTLRGAPAVGAESPLLAVDAYMAVRAAAADPSRAAAVVGPMSSSVRAYESERASYLRSQGQRFDFDGTILSRTSAVNGVEVVSRTARDATVRLYDKQTISWVPNPRKPIPLTKAEKQRVEAEPARYGLGEASPNSVQSLVGSRHELTLNRSASGWAVVGDAYDEPSEFGASPQATGSVYVQALSTSRQSAQAGQTPVGVPDGTATAFGSFAYDWNAACNYARQYGYSYNSNYVSYNSCGGDCANFVSQCFFWGNEVADPYWYRLNGSACGYSNRWIGNGTQWYNNWGLHNWAINQGRSVDISGWGALGYGDIINYDWDQNGSYQHVAIVTDVPGKRVSAHNADHIDYPWQLGDSTANHKFSHMWSLYPNYP